jgi:hypothetical protein
MPSSSWWTLKMEACSSEKLVLYGIVYQQNTLWTLSAVETWQLKSIPNLKTPSHSVKNGTNFIYFVVCLMALSVIQTSYIEKNDWMIVNCERRQLQPNLRYCPGNCLWKRWRKSRKPQDNRCPGRDSNRASPEYKSGALPVIPICSMVFISDKDKLYVPISAAAQIMVRLGQGFESGIGFHL